jgi:hypothetical protein
VRQLLQGACGAHLLAGGAQVDAALPVEPVRAVDRCAAVPAFAAVEFGDERERKR